MFSDRIGRFLEDQIRPPKGVRLAVMSLAGILASGCGGGPAVESIPVPAPVIIPAGVDSSVAAYADSVADLSFVDLVRQEQAAEFQLAGQSLLEQSDSLWQTLAGIKTPPNVSPEDSARAWDAASEGGRALVELDRTLRDSDLDTDALAAQTASLLDSAEVALERAFELNPFDPRSRLWLSRVYELQARRLGQAEAYRQAIDELEKLAELTPDQHSVFAMLANNYYRLEEWGPAAQNYERAEDVYRKTFDLVADQPVSLDSALLFTYVRAQAEMHVQRMDAARAAGAFEESLGYAPTEDDSAYVKGELEWMAWDDMNLASSFARDSLAALEQRGELGAARNGYARLLPQLTAQRAIDEIDWRVAIVDYNLGEGEQAAVRLQGLVSRTATDADGAPLDSTYARYLDDYGTLCLNLGRDFLHDRKDNRTALKYFEQAARVVWPRRAVAYLEIATLLQSNVPGSLENASRALDGEADLTVDQRKDLYRLLMGLYRRSGEFDQARRFRDAYRSLQDR